MIGDTYKIAPEHDHYVVYINGEFYCSADTCVEAANELEKYMSKERNAEVSC